MTLKTSKRKMKKTYFQNFICLILFIGVTIFGFLIYHSSEAEAFKKDKRNIIKPVTMEGVYKWNEDDEWIPFNDLSNIPTKNTQLIIKGHTKENIPHGNKIFLYSEKISIKVNLNGQEIYSDNDEINTKWGIVNTLGITSDDEITIVMKNNRNTILNTEFHELLTRLSYGSIYDFLQKQIKDNMPYIMICIVVFIIGIATLFLVITLRFLGLPALRGHEAFGMLLIVGACCTFINYDYITLIFNNAFIVNIVDFMLELLIVEFLIINLSTYVKTKKYKKVVNLTVILWTVFIFAYMILRVFGLVVEVELANKVAPGVIILLAVEVYCMVKDYNHNKNTGTRYVFYSGIILAVFTSIEVVYYSMTHVFLLFFFQIGLLIYTFIQACILIKYSKESIIQSVRVREMEKEMIRNKVEIMLSQIKPHFLYNTLATIKALCLKDVNLARTAIDYFSKYLRANMNSISEKECIPFSRELSHVKSYLYIEKLRFDELLNVEYDIGVENFSCPPLLLQTMVENAVKHGICNKREGGTVLIKTYETEDVYIISIIDNGAGFDVNSNTEDEERTHIGIENTRQRLKEMCNGKLKIESKPGNGTTVTIVIPKGVRIDESNCSG